MHLDDVRTPALVLDLEVFERNVATMSAVRPSARLRPHVKAFKSTAMARRLAEAGHRSFCCATLREIEGMIEAGLTDDLLLANETLDTDRLRAISESTQITIAVDSPETLKVAIDAGVASILIDIDVGLPRCGCSPEEGSALASTARDSGLDVRGVMGYEGHLMHWTNRDDQRFEVDRSMQILVAAQRLVGGLTSAGGTGTYDFHADTDEVQAGSYVMMDTHYQQVGLPFEQAAFVLATVISVSRGETSWFVIDAGLKALGMDHGDPSLGPGSPNGSIFFVSDEHTTILCSDDTFPAVGDPLVLMPAHIDPTAAKHHSYEVVNNLASGTIVDSWPIDLRGW